MESVNLLLCGRLQMTSVTTWSSRGGQGQSELPEGDGGSVAILPEKKKAHRHLRWVFFQIAGSIYFLDFFAFALIALAATFGFAAFVLIAIDSPTFERRRTLRLTALP